MNIEYFQGSIDCLDLFRLFRLSHFNKRGRGWLKEGDVLLWRGVGPLCALWFSKTETT